MLKKIVKKDLQATARYFLPLILGFLAISVLGKILFEVGIVSSTNNAFIVMVAVIFLSFYVLYLITFYILTFVFLVADFYKTMVGEQGYLTHTLPVKVSTLINSKLIISIIWQLVMGVLILLSLVMFAAGHMSSIHVQTFISEIIPEFERALGMTFPQYMGFMVSALIVGAIGSPLMFYVSIALGHLFGKHRIMGAILSYLGISSVTQIISTFTLVAFGYTITKPMDVIHVSVMEMGIGTSSTDFTPAMMTFMWFAILLTVITSFLYYILTHYIFKKKLNLE